MSWNFPSLMATNFVNVHLIHSSTTQCISARQRTYPLAHECLAQVVCEGSSWEFGLSHWGLSSLYELWNSS